MDNHASQKIVVKLWNDFNHRNWDSARQLLSDNFKAQWPQSKELITGPDNFIELNKNYPGSHHIEIINTTTEHDKGDNSDTIITQVKIQSKMPDGKEVELFAVSFFTVEDDERTGEKKITSAVEYWADTYEAPSWRSKYVNAD